MAAFVKPCCMRMFTYMCDQESAFKTMIDEAVHVTKGKSEWVGAAR